MDFLGKKIELVEKMIDKLRRRYEQRVGRRDQLKDQLTEANSALRRLRRKASIAEQAQNIVRVVALETQRQLEYRITQTVSAAEEAVFGLEGYELAVEFVERRGKTECDLHFTRDGHDIDPLSGAGLGAVDVAAFALRIACWSMMRTQSPVFILDESFKHLKGVSANRRSIEMVKEVSDELGLQIIMISDERAPIEDIQSGADRVFRVGIKNGISSIYSD